MFMGLSMGVNRPSKYSLAPGNPPVNTVAPTITGTPTVGQTMTCNPGTWTGATGITYQWVKGLGDIPGANSSTYVITAQDVTFLLACRVTGINSAGTTSALSNGVLVT
jgi:hypothetical protein